MSTTTFSEEKNLSNKENWFGDIWKSYVEQKYSREAVEEAKASISNFLERNDLRGHSFLDIGCGSGLFSLAALELGAAKVISADMDSKTVACARTLWETAGKPDHWIIKQGSILDANFQKSLPVCDIVYAWGVLQHTGDMWLALRHSSKLIQSGGCLYLAVYNHVDGFGPMSSQFWIVEKKIFHRLPHFLQEIVFQIVKAIIYCVRLLMLKKPQKKMRRGMDSDINLRAWLGAWPCEFASAEEVIRLCEQELGLKLIKTNLTKRLGNNEFLFRRSAI